jgi:hypothetical protein
MALQSETNANAQLVSATATDTAVINETTSSTVPASRSAVNTGTKRPRKKRGGAANAGMCPLSQVKGPG